MDPEFVHDQVLQAGKLLGMTAPTRLLTRKVFAFASPMLEQDLLDIHFSNPIGLSAGFDKNAELTDVLPSVGFGFAEVGSITGEPCAGNPKQRLWRLPKSESLLVYYGLKNDGAVAIAKHLRKKQFAIPIGISIAKTNNQACAQREAGIADYAKAYTALADIGAYTTINISCPNTFGGQPFTDPESLDQLLSVIDTIPSRKPIFIKLSPDLGTQLIDKILAVIDRHNVRGIICSNLTKDHHHPAIKDEGMPSVGGFSGKVVQELADELIRYVYAKTQGKYVIIGCGGVFTAEDAYKKIKLGSSLIQLITGMIFRGPQLIGELNRGLVDLLKRDGYQHISEAVGVDNK